MPEFEPESPASCSEVPNSRLFMKTNDLFTSVEFYHRVSDHLSCSWLIASVSSLQQLQWALGDVPLIHTKSNCAFTPAGFDLCSPEPPACGWASSAVLQLPSEVCFGPQPTALSLEERIKCSCNIYVSLTGDIKDRRQFSCAKIEAKMDVFVSWFC